MILAGSDQPVLTICDDLLLVLSIWSENEIYEVIGPDFFRSGRKIQTQMSELDDLLEELDLDGSSSGKSTNKSQIPIISTVMSTGLKIEAKPTKPLSSKNVEDVDVDSLLDDLDSVSPTAKVLSRSNRNNDDVKKSTDATSFQRKGKCLTICVGGTRDQQGMGPGYACDRLRCSKCDFNVARFSDTAWSERCDYLFFRNFFPDVDKLRANMESKKGNLI